MSHFQFPIQFETHDIIRLLKKKYYFVGTHFHIIKDCIETYENQYGYFFNNGIWKIGYNRTESNDNNSIQILFDRVDQLKRGNFLIAKKLLGKGNTKMKIFAIGIIVDYLVNKNFERIGVKVSWIFPDLNISYKAISMSTISSKQYYNDNPETQEEIKLNEIIDKALVRFLKNHLNIKPIHITY